MLTNRKVSPQGLRGAIFSPAVRAKRCIALQTGLVTCKAELVRVAAATATETATVDGAVARSEVDILIAKAWSGAITAVSKMWNEKNAGSRSENVALGVELPVFWKFGTGRSDSTRRDSQSN